MPERQDWIKHGSIRTRLLVPCRPFSADRTIDGGAEISANLLAAGRTGRQAVLVVVVGITPACTKHLRFIRLSQA